MIMCENVTRFLGGTSNKTSVGSYACINKRSEGSKAKANKSTGVCDPQTELLGDHIRTLQRALRAGLKRLNWNSLGIHEYIAKCEKVRERRRRE